MTSKLIAPELARKIRDEFQARQEIIEALIKTLVELESPSGDFDGSRAVVDVLVRAVNDLRCVTKVERVDVPGFGQNLVIEAFSEQQAAGQILFVGHTDTVHDRSDQNVVGIFLLDLTKFIEPDINRTI